MICTVIFRIVMAFLLVAAGTACTKSDDNRICLTQFSVKNTSPDGKYIALQSDDCYSGQGYYDAKVIALRRRDEQDEDAQEVFITFKDRPTITWESNAVLKIAVNGENAINRSDRSFDGIRIEYVLAPSLKKALAAELAFHEKNGGDKSEVLKGSEEDIRKQSDDFFQWAKHYIDSR